MATKSIGLKQFHPKELSRHATGRDCWVSFKGRVFNVTKFLEDHPGGEDLVLAYAGKDIELAMKDISGGHDHSKAAYAMLEDYCIGKLATQESLIDPNWVPDENFHPEESHPEDDFKKSEFLDLNRPLVMQVFRSNWSKEFYLEQVHQPRHLTRSANLLGPPWLEFLSLTPWYVVPMIWGPISMYLFYKAQLQFAPAEGITTQSFGTVISLWAAGCFLWTILEYSFHRFLFHLDDYLPDHPYAFALHFLLHGVHHYLPMDKMRLVMPPTLFFALQYPFTTLAWKHLPEPLCNAVISGVFSFYIIYDCMHYALHHTKLPQYLTEMKKYHLAHHYRNYELGFGITTKFWDYVFGTVGGDA